VATLLRVLTDAEIAGIHEQSLAVLATTGMRVDSGEARRILAAAGAEVDEEDRRVRFPRSMVEASLAAAPRRFSLGGRRPGFSLPMNAGECTLMPDGEATTVYDTVAGIRRPPTFDDWAGATKLVDTMDEVGAYWRMVTSGLAGSGPGPAVAHWATTYALFSKHVQDEIATAEDASWLLELLVVIFGDREVVRRDHPFSVLYCPVSPLAMEAEHTDAWLATAGWDIPIAVMPMPIMGLTAPVGLLSTIVLGNAEVLGTICLVQAAARGTPVIYAPALAAMEPRSGRWGGGSPEHALLGAATTEMGRYYGLPVIASNGGTDHYVPGIQAAYERTLNWTLPLLSWPDILIGPVARRSVDPVPRADRHRRGGVLRLPAPVPGIGAGIGEATWRRRSTRSGRGASAREATRDAVRAGEYFLPRLGYHGTFDRFLAAGAPDMLAQARETANAAIAGHQPIPFPDEVAAELSKLELRARGAVPAATHGAR
jgi:trimethylamine--corrinoid protein Co-methyltransferase